MEKLCKMFLCKEGKIKPQMNRIQVSQQLINTFELSSITPLEKSFFPGPLPSRVSLIKTLNLYVLDPSIYNRNFKNKKLSVVG